MRYGGREHSPVKRVSILLGVVLVALAAVQTAAADRRGVADPRRDFKGSHWPGPGATWSQANQCWILAGATGCGEGDYFENQGGRLDIVTARHAHQGRLLAHRLVTSRRWAPALLSQGGQISFFFSTDADAAFERRLDVLPARRGLRGVMRNSRGGVVGRASATRPNGSSVEVAFARRLLGAGVRSYRWLAFAGIECRRKYNACGDRAPNSRLARHALGGSARSTSARAGAAISVRRQAARAARRAASRYVERFGISTRPADWLAHCSRTAPRRWRCHVVMRSGQCSGYVRLVRRANGTFAVRSRNIGCGE